MVHGVQVGHRVHVRVLEVVEGGVEGQASAHPEEHSSAEAVSGSPEVVATVAGVLQVLGHGLDLLLRLERGQLESQGAAVLVREEVVELGGIGIHAAHEVLNAVQLDGCDALTWRGEIRGRRWLKESFKWEE